MTPAEELSVDRDWSSEYDRIVSELPDLIASAPMIAGGFSACVDQVVKVKATDYAVLKSGLASSDPEIKAVAGWIVDRVESGRGGEVVTGRTGFEWIDSSFVGTPSMGGTGAQVARVLGILGAPQVLALSDRSAMQLDSLDPVLRLVSDDGRLVDPASVPRTSVPNDGIYVFEFTKGIDLGDGRLTERSTRIIFRAPARPIDLDESFARYVRDHDVAALLLSGFQTADPSALPDDQGWIAERFGHMRREGRLVHLEMAEYESPEHARSAVFGLAGTVTSLGLSLSELALLSDIADPVAAAVDAAVAHGLDRVSVHADDFAFAVTRGDVEVERDALLTGCVIAAARAVYGTPVLPTRLPDHLEIGSVPDGIADRDLVDGYRLVSVPSPYTPTPTVTLGLGDTFVAGMLLRLAAAAGSTPRTTTSSTATSARNGRS